MSERIFHSNCWLKQRNTHLTVENLVNCVFCSIYVSLLVFWILFLWNLISSYKFLIKYSQYNFSFGLFIISLTCRCCVIAIDISSEIVGLHLSGKYFLFIQSRPSPTGIWTKTGDMETGGKEIGEKETRENETREKETREKETGEMNQIDRISIFERRTIMDQVMAETDGIRQPKQLKMIGVIENMKQPNQSATILYKKCWNWIVKPN